MSGVEPGVMHPDLPAMRRWLCSGALIGPRGAIRSWVNPNNPGYDYPEAGGLWLSAMLGGRGPVDLDPSLSSLANRVGSWIVEQVETDGAVSRFGRRYTFDAAMVLRGLSDAQAAGVLLRGADDAIARLTDYVLNSVVARRASFPTGTGDAAERWSENFGPHLLKLALALPAEVLADFRVRQQILWPAFGYLLSLEHDGRFPVYMASGATYLHAHCYAVEGLLRLGDALEGARDAAQRAAAWLAEVQRADGALHAWADHNNAWGPLRTDATAQAVRIWAILGGYESEIARALRFLATLQTTDGGIRYEPESDDVNSWVTLFTMQAADFATRAAMPSGLERAIV
jgi:hypothetical protein